MSSPGYVATYLHRLGAASYQGHIRMTRPRNVGVWECRHRHRSPAAATSCADRSLDRIVKAHQLAEDVMGRGTRPLARTRTSRSERGAVDAWVKFHEGDGQPQRVRRLVRIASSVPGLPPAEAEWCEEKGNRVKVIYTASRTGAWVARRRVLEATS